MGRFNLGHFDLQHLTYDVLTLGCFDLEHFNSGTF